MKNAAPRQRGNREYDDEKHPSAGVPRLLRTTVLLFVGSRLTKLVEAFPHAYLPSPRGSGRDHAHPQSLGHEARATPASFTDTQSQRTTRLHALLRATVPAGAQGEGLNLQFTREPPLLEIPRELVRGEDFTPLFTVPRHEEQ